MSTAAEHLETVCMEALNKSHRALRASGVKTVIPNGFKYQTDEIENALCRLKNKGLALRDAANCYRPAAGPKVHTETLPSTGQESALAHFRQTPTPTKAAPKTVFVTDADGGRSLATEEHKEAAGKSIRLLIVEALNDGPLNADEIAQRTQIALQKVTSNLYPAATVGIVVNTGQKRNGKTLWAKGDTSGMAKPKSSVVEGSADLPQELVSQLSKPAQAEIAERRNTECPPTPTTGGGASENTGAAAEGDGGTPSLPPETVEATTEPAAPARTNILDTPTAAERCERAAREARAALKAYISALAERDPQLRALLNLRDAAEAAARDVGATK